MIIVGIYCSLVFLLNRSVYRGGLWNHWFLAALSLHKKQIKADNTKYLEENYKCFISITMLIVDIAWNANLLLIVQ